MPKEERYPLRQVEVRLKLNDAKPLYSNSHIMDPHGAIEVLKKALSEMDREYFCVVNLDTKNRPIHFNIVSIGDIDQVPIPTQNVFKSAILSNAASIMAFHNHPSGDITPSRADLNITEKLVYAGKLMNIPVLDHIIVGDGAYISIRELDENLFTHDSPRFEMPPGINDLRPERQANEFRNIVDYAREKKVDVHVINGFVSAHRDEFVGHIRRDKVGAAVDRWGLEKIESYINNKPKYSFNRFTREQSKRREIGMKMTAEEKKERYLTPDEVDKLYKNTNAYIDTDRGRWPFAEYLDLKSSQHGFDDYQDLRRQGMSLEYKDSMIIIEAPSDAERGVDIPDMNDGIDDRISVSGGNPSLNPFKAKAKSVNHYSLSKQRSVIEQQLKKKEAEVEALRKEMKAFDKAIDFSVRDVIDPER